MHSVHFPSSFYPRQAYPRRIVAEGRIPGDVVTKLESWGHEVEVTDDWANGKTMVIRYDTERGVIAGGVSAKGNIGYALGW